MSRILTLLPENFTAAQQQLFDSITGGKRAQNSAADSFLNPDGSLRGPFNAMLFNPILGEATQQLGAAIRFEGTLPPQLREIAILTMATKWQAQYEWWAHEKIAREAGLDSAVIAEIKAGELSDSADPAQMTVYRFARTLMEQHHVSDEQYQQAVGLLGESGVVELVMLLGYYTLISMLLNTFEVPLPAGEKMPFNDTNDIA